MQGCGLAWSLWRRLRWLPGVRRDAFGEARAAFFQRVRTPSARAQRGFEVFAMFVQGQARRFSAREDAFGEGHGAVSRSPLGLRWGRCGSSRA